MLRSYIASDEPVIGTRNRESARLFIEMSIWRMAGLFWLISQTASLGRPAMKLTSDLMWTAWASTAYRSRTRPRRKSRLQRKSLARYNLLELIGQIWIPPAPQERRSSRRFPLSPNTGTIPRCRSAKPIAPSGSFNLLTFVRSI